MAHFARVRDGVVKEIIAVKNCAIGGCVSPDSPDYDPADHVNCGNLEFPDTEPIGKEFIKSIGLDGEWFQCSFSGAFRGTLPGPDFLYDYETETFYAPEGMFQFPPEFQGT